MKIFKKIQALFHDDWCHKCQTPMYIDKKKLYMLPVSVDHYQPHGKDANYIIKNLYPVTCKKDIETGYYACGIIRYKCSNPICSYEVVKLSVFLPVRDQEKYEEIIYFENKELDSFLNKLD